MKLKWAALPLAVVAACGEPDPEESVAREANDPNAAEETAGFAAGPLDAAITLGSFESAVTDLAAFEAPTFGFRSRIYAANGSAGIAVVQADGQDPRTIETEAAPFRLATVYGFRDGAVLSLSEGGQLEIFSPDGTTRYFGEQVWDGAVQDFCAGDVAGDTALTIVTAEGGARNFILTDGDTGPAIEAQFSEDIGGITDCAIVDGRLILKGGDTWATDESNSAAGAALVAVHDEGLTTVTATAEGLRVGTEVVALADDLGDPIAPQRVEVAPGNFGGVLRDGALIVLDEQRGLHLVPWSAFANRVDLPRTLSSDRVREERTATGFELDASAEELRPQQEQPRFEEQELPEPPGR